MIFATSARCTGDVGRLGVLLNRTGVVSSARSHTSPLKTNKISFNVKPVSRLVAPTEEFHYLQSKGVSLLLDDYKVINGITVVNTVFWIEWGPRAPVGVLYDLASVHIVPN